MTRTAVVVDPVGPAAHYPAVLAELGAAAVAVLLPLTARTRAQRTPPPPDGYQRALTHTTLTTTLAGLRGLDIVAVLAGTPAAVPTADHLAAALGVPGTGTPPADDHRARPAVVSEQLAAAGIATPPTLETTSPIEASRWARLQRLPAGAVVVKPSLPTPGIVPRRCMGTGGLAAAIRTARAAAPGQSVLVQEYVPGPAYTATTVTRPSGAPTDQLTATWAEVRSPTERLTRLDLLRPDATVTSALDAYLRLVLAVLGITAGPARHQIIWSPQGPVLINSQPCPETAWHPAGTQPIPPGTDHIRDTAHTLLTGQLPRPAPTVGNAGDTPPYATRLVLAARETGVITAPLHRALLHLPTLAATTSGLTPGTPVTRTWDQDTSPGQLLLTATDPAAIALDIETVRHLERSGLYAPAVLSHTG